MKRYYKILGLLFLIALVTACTSNKKIVLPMPQNVTEIKLADSDTENKVSITKQDEIKSIIDDLVNDSKITKKDSINDAPTNVDEYIGIYFTHKGTGYGESVTYVYKKDGINYLEQPYSEIWKLGDKTFDNINQYFEK
ncbi:DUF5301 domain-containing protein [Peptoniphilus asaccharolyticus]